MLLIPARPSRLDRFCSARNADNVSANLPVRPRWVVSALKSRARSTIAAR